MRFHTEIKILQQKTKISPFKMMICGRAGGTEVGCVDEMCIGNTCGKTGPLVHKQSHQPVAREIRRQRFTLCPFYGSGSIIWSRNAGTPGPLTGCLHTCVLRRGNGPPAADFVCAPGTQLLAWAAEIELPGADPALGQRDCCGKGH